MENNKIGSQPKFTSKQPSDDEITLVISEIANHYQSGLASSLHQQYYISKVRNLFQDHPSAIKK